MLQKLHAAAELTDCLDWNKILLSLDLPTESDHAKIGSCAFPSFAEHIGIEQIQSLSLDRRF
jgi:hypothetical protein